MRYTRSIEIMVANSTQLEQAMATELDELLADIEAAIARLHDELRLEERMRERVLKRRNERAGQPIPHIPPVVEARGHRLAGTMVEGSLISRIIGILHAANRPMKAKEIAIKLKTQGFTTTAKSGLNIAISSQLSHACKAGKLDRVGHGKYAIKPETP